MTQLPTDAAGPVAPCIDVETIATALAEAYSAPDMSNPDYKGYRRTPEEPERIPWPGDSRLRQSPYVVFTGTDGHLSFRVPTFVEIAEVLVAALQPAATD